MNHFFKPIDLLTIMQVKNKRMARFTANKLLLKRAISAHTRKSVGALSRADRPDGANPSLPPSPPFWVVGDSFSLLKIWRAG